MTFGINSDKLKIDRGKPLFSRVTFELFLSGKKKIDNEISYKQIELDLVTGE